jgi:hypothetical protein
VDFLLGTSRLTNYDPVALPYPSLSLLIAAMHAETAGHEDVTFEMLYECFHNQFRTSSAAPVQIEGGGIGILRCTKDVLMGVRLFDLVLLIMY